MLMPVCTLKFIASPLSMSVFRILRPFAVALLVTVVFAGCGSDRKTNNEQAGSSETSPAVPEDRDKPREPAQSDAAGNDADEEPTPKSRPELLAEINRQINAQQYDVAKSGLRELLLRDPQDYESLVRLANLHATERDYETAIDLVAAVPVDHPDAGLPALGLSADWCFEAQRFDDAEQRYRQVLELDFSMNVARRKLAYLLNRKGHRHEANRLVKTLCLLGDVTQDELHSLIVQSDAIYDPPGSPARPGTRPYWPIGVSGEARHLFASQDYTKAAQLMRPLVESGKATSADLALFGRSAVESQDDELMVVWAKHVDAEVKKLPDYWAALGTYYLREADFPKALRALAEAIRLDPTDFTCTRQLFQCLRSMNRTEEAEVWVKRYSLMHQILENSNRVATSANDSEAIYQLAETLNQSGRRIEAILWQSIAAVRAKDQTQLTGLQDQRNQVLSAKVAFPKRELVWCGMDFSTHSHCRSSPPNFR